MVNITVTYLGDLRCSLVHGPSGATILTDAPVDNHGKGEAFSPTDLVVAALGACISTVVGIVAQRHHWDLAGMRIELAKEMSKDMPRRIVSITVDVFMPTDFSENDRVIIERTAHTCPVAKSIHPDIKTPMTFHWGKN